MRASIVQTLYHDYKINTIEKIHMRASPMDHLYGS
jgi:hypothetical protein